MGNMEHFLGLKSLTVHDSNVENIFLINGENGQQMNFELLEIDLSDMPLMMCLFVGAKNSFVFKNLAKIELERCEKLEFVFSTSVLRCLPQLLYLRIQECKVLKYIIENNLEDKKSSITCFPKLKSFHILGCNKLKCVFPISICKELPELNLMSIIEAHELKEIFKSEGDDQKLEIPKLKFIVIAGLPRLCKAQGYQFQAVKYRCVYECQNLSLTSASTADNICDDHNIQQGKII